MQGFACAPLKRVRVGLIGLGSRGMGAALRLPKIPGVELVAVASWGKHLIAPTLALPSTGLWGDIGYVVFRTDADGATASLVQSDFFFQTPTAHPVRPRQWDVRTRENQGKTMRFAFERN